jgi:hypothetical protein
VIETLTIALERKLAELGYETYEAYLQSGRWAGARISYTEAGLPQCCVICGRQDFHLHHRSYEFLGDEPPFHLVALCEDHHYEVHKLLKKELPGVTLWKAHRVYQEQWLARRRRRAPRPFREISPALIFGEPPSSLSGSQN